MLIFHRNSEAYFCKKNKNGEIKLEVFYRVNNLEKVLFLMVALSCLDFSLSLKTLKTL